MVVIFILLHGTTSWTRHDSAMDITALAQDPSLVQLVAS